jgi:galactose mutarotase-like enzyme
MITLKNIEGKSSATINQGELISYKIDGEEIIHQKGSPGWCNSDTEMFPVIGPTAQNNFKIPSPKGGSFQDQHGILREMSYKLIKSDSVTAVFEKKYKANTPLLNSKFPDKSSIEKVSWPYDFRFQKSFFLNEQNLYIEFLIESPVGMPFMLGYHPAFLLSGKNLIEANGQEISIPEIMAGGSKAFPVLDCQKIILHKEPGSSIKISTQGFGHFMLWTEVDNMLCIEPITQYPYVGKMNFEEKMFRILKGREYFSVLIEAIGPI